MKQLTYGTSCFEAFLNDFLLGDDDYYVEKKPTNNVRFFLDQNARYAAVYVASWKSCMKRIKLFGGGL